MISVILIINCFSSAYSINIITLTLLHYSPRAFLEMILKGCINVILYLFSVQKALLVTDSYLCKLQLLIEPQICGWRFLLNLQILLSKVRQIVAVYAHLQTDKFPRKDGLRNCWKIWNHHWTSASSVLSELLRMNRPPWLVGAEKTSYPTHFNLHCK